MLPFFCVVKKLFCHIFSIRIDYFFASNLLPWILFQSFRSYTVKIEIVTLTLGVSNSLESSWCDFTILDCLLLWMTKFIELLLFLLHLLDLGLKCKCEYHFSLSWNFRSEKKKRSILSVLCLSNRLNIIGYARVISKVHIVGFIHTLV